MRIANSLTLLLLILWSNCLLAQNNNQSIHGWISPPFLFDYQRLVESKPKEVHFGLYIEDNGDVIFQLDSVWFDKLFKPGMGITADIVSMDRYDCAKTIPDKSLFKGQVLPQLRYENFKSRRLSLVDGEVTLKIGKVPRELLKKQLEPNLVIVNQNRVCYYTNFVDIDRLVWDLLPMGFYMDTVVNLSLPDSLSGRSYTYQRAVEMTVPFEKNKDTYNGSRVQNIIDSLSLGICNIKRVDIRAYSSVEGAEGINRRLMKGRADAMVSALKIIQPDLKRINILTAENWMEFYRDIQATRMTSLGGQTRPEIKLRLQNRPVADSLEPMLAKERKALLTIYYEQRHGPQNMPKEALLNEFSQAVVGKQIIRARNIQRQIFDLINDNKLPETYLDRLEVPNEKTYWELINDRIIFKYQISLSDENEALQAFEELIALDPGNGRIGYNICVLTLKKWQYHDSVDQRHLLDDINRLEQQAIDRSLVKRLLVNYYILQSNELLNLRRYEEKDEAVKFIKDSYQPLPLTDQDRLSLAKYFEFYSQSEWAEEVIANRVDQLNVSEDLVFYYVNLGFFKANSSSNEKFMKALINCFTLNRQRFCRFFRPYGKGGASMQLLEDFTFRQIYCEKCRQTD